MTSLNEQICTVRYGSMTFPNWSCKVLALGVDMESRSTVGVKNVLPFKGSIGSMAANGLDSMNGMWHGSTMESRDGAVILFKAIQSFKGAPIRRAIIPIRIRNTGPLINLRGVFPTVSGFANSDVMFFSGRGDVLTKSEMRELAVMDVLHPIDRRTCFDTAEIAECFSITTFDSVVGYQDRPHFMAIKKQGMIVGSTVAPTPLKRKVRVSAKKSAPTRRRRRKS